ncbi:MAG TPA: cytochrome c oxidase assembly protein [Pirellulales bacterium]|nr:cytochrome c oxidase assembly protein [Pirellulales bacterium]
MSATINACLRSWPWDPWLLAACLLSVAVYHAGWRALRRRDPRRWHGARLASFSGGVVAIYLALASPIEPLASLLLEVHMLQHLLLIMAAPPLMWLGAPMFPLIRGLPRSIRTHWVVPLVSFRGLRWFFRRLTHPVVALPVLVASTWLWHIPPAYELALRSQTWHYVQHVSFLAAGLVFWYPVVRPFPSRPRWSAWFLLPYLVLADVQNTVLSALLTFSGKVLYPYYAEVPRIANITPLDDQTTAGVLMWVPGSVAFLGPLFAIGLRLLYGTETGRGRPKVARSVTARGSVVHRLPVLYPAPTRPEPANAPPLALRLLERFLHWRHARLALQVPLLIIAAAVIYDGLRGPQASPLNLAGVLPWTHWRGLVVLCLLAVGNVSCMACPFTLPRRLAGRWLPRRRAWPRRLRSKWLAVALVVLFLWAYEAFALWDNPWWTAWITVGYFATAFAVDGFFHGGTFCKYLCPIGQFNFVQSLVSPFEVAVRDRRICTDCRTKDCLRGRAGIPGCELDLFQPRKSGNLDCTFCLDCVQACPHANVGLVASLPGSQLWHDRFRSGVGHLSQRTDVAVLVLVLVFGAFANAAGMVGPVVEWERQVRVALDLSPRLIVTIYYLAAIVLAPLTIVGATSIVSHRWARLSPPPMQTARKYSYALIPVAFVMWLVHYDFHLFTGYSTIVPATQRFAADLGFAGFGEPRWSCACCAPSPDWLLRAELMALDLGFLLSLYTAYRLSAADCSNRWQMLKAMLPWSALISLLFFLGIWIVFQPMEMRGTLTGAG